MCLSSAKKILNFPDAVTDLDAGRQGSFFQSCIEKNSLLANFLSDKLMEIQSEGLTEIKVQNG